MPRVSLHFNRPLITRDPHRVHKQINCESWITVTDHGVPIVDLPLCSISQLCSLQNILLFLVTWLRIAVCSPNLLFPSPFIHHPHLWNWFISQGRLISHNWFFPYTYILHPPRLRFVSHWSWDNSQISCHVHLKVVIWLQSRSSASFNPLENVQTIVSYHSQLIFTIGVIFRPK